MMCTFTVQHSHESNKTVKHNRKHQLTITPVCAMFVGPEVLDETTDAEDKDTTKHVAMCTLPEQDNVAQLLLMSHELQQESLKENVRRFCDFIANSTVQQLQLREDVLLRALVELPMADIKKIAHAKAQSNDTYALCAIARREYIVDCMAREFCNDALERETTFALYKYVHFAMERINRQHIVVEKYTRLVHTLEQQMFLSQQVLHQEIAKISRSHSTMANKQKAIKQLKAEALVQKDQILIKLQQVRNDMQNQVDSYKLVTTKQRLIYQRLFRN